MKRERFGDAAPGQLLQLPHRDGPYWAFVPDPLPPALAMDAELWRVSEAAAHALGELSGLGRAMPNPYLLVNPLIRREAVSSSRIEGTRADIADLYAFEAGQLSLPGMPPPPEGDVQEVINYVRALEHGLERVKTLPVSCRLIREVHERLLAGVRGERSRPGEFRASQNLIAGPLGRTVHDAVFVPPPVEQMREAMDHFETYLHKEDDEYPLLVRLALIHYQFEAIHPFRDGNGRVGRLLMSLLLVHWNLMPLPLLHLSAYFEQHREQYCDLLLAVSERGAWREWVLFFLQGVEEQARDAARRAGQLQELQDIWRRSVVEDGMKGVATRIIGRLFEKPVLSAREVADEFGVSPQAAMQALRRLEEAEIVREVTGKQRNRLYAADGILDIFQ